MAQVPVIVLPPCPLGLPDSYTGCRSFALHVPQPSRRGSWKTSVFCHELSCSPCRRRSFAVPFLHIVPPSRSVPPPSVRAVAGLDAPWRRDPVLRAFRACAPAPACARLAPARFAHLIARARRRTHVSRPFPPELFSAPAIASLCRRAKRRPQGAASLHPSYTTFSPVKPPDGRNMKIFPTPR